MAADLQAAIRALPKVELHLHLDGCMSYEAVASLEPGITRETFDSEFVAPDQLDGLAGFLARTTRHLALLQTPEALVTCITDLYGQLAADNVVYAEARFAPHLHTQLGMTIETVVATMAEAMELLNQTGPTTGRLLLCSLWTDPPEYTEQILELVQTFAPGGIVVGMDVAGNEADPQRFEHLAVLAKAQAAGVNFTVHAGEGNGPQSVHDVLDLIQPVRIGHGVRAIEDPPLLDRLATAGTHLEMCPSCNVQLGLYPEMAAHPIRRFLEAGISAGISTDQRTITNTTVTNEYLRLATADETFWDVERFRSCNRMAFAASFADDATRARIGPIL
jgi:adenosine deaminase